MKLIATDGRFSEYQFPDGEPLQAALLERLLARHARADGSVHALCLDFAGQYVPIVCAAELRLASALVCAHHNAHGFPRECTVR